MSTVWTLIKINIKSSFRLDRASKKSITAIKGVAFFAFMLALLFLFVAMYAIITFNISGTFPVSGANGTIYVNLKSEILSFTFLGFHVVQILFLLPILIKHLKIGNDREMLLRLPVTGKQVFMSRIITIYILETAFATIVLLPILIAYGIMSAVAWYFWLTIPLLLILAPVFPFFIAILLAAPINSAISYIKSHRNVMIVSYLGLGLVFMWVYMYIVTLASRLVLEKGLFGIMQKSYHDIVKVADTLIFQNMFANAIIKGNGLSVIAVFLTSIALAVTTIYIARYIYNYYYNNDNVKTYNIKIKDRTNPKSPTRAYLVKELKNINRSSNYAFQFLVFVVVLPLFVFMCVRVAGIASIETFKQNNLNQNIDKNANTQATLMGIALLVFLIIIPLAASFAAISVSREGGNIYQCKTLPIGFRRQVMIKTLIVFLPMLLSIIIGVILVRVPQKFDTFTTLRPVDTVGEVLGMFGIITGVTLGLVCLGVVLDLYSPMCKSIGNGELTKTNRATVVVLITGLVIAVGMGLPLMFKSFMFKNIDLVTIYLVFSIVFGLSMLALLWWQSERLFAKIVGA